MPELSELTIETAHKGLLKKEFSAHELAQSCLDSIEKKNPALNAYLEVFSAEGGSPPERSSRAGASGGDDVLAQAEIADKRLREEGESAHQLLGIPFAMKDNILIKGRVTSCSSKILEGYRASYDATVTRKLREAGAVFLGRTNMDEFAMGSSTENSAFGVTKNPYDESRVPGGSSGGSATAVASGGALAALGSDTGGSVRQPAAFCGLVGLKPTYGAVSRSGLVAMASSFDQIGPLTKTVGDARIVYEAIAGFDEKDGTSCPLATIKKIKKNSKEKMTVGILQGEALKGLHPGVLENYKGAIKTLEKGGYATLSVEIPLMQYVLPVYYIIMPAEVSSNLARFDGVRYGLHKEGGSLLGDYVKSRGEGFGDETRRRILLGTYVLSSGYYDAYYSKALAVRNTIKNGVDKLFENVHAIMLPTTPEPAFKIGEKKNDPLAMYLSDIFTSLANVTGMPAISVPSGTVALGKVSLPVAVQFMGPHWSEDILFEIGESFEKLLTTHY